MPDSNIENFLMYPTNNNDVEIRLTQDTPTTLRERLLNDGVAHKYISALQKENARLTQLLENHITYERHFLPERKDSAETVPECPSDKRIVLIGEVDSKVLSFTTYNDRFLIICEGGVYELVTGANRDSVIEKVDYSDT